MNISINDYRMMYARREASRQSRIKALSLPIYTFNEEMLNCVTHALGAVLGIAGWLMSMKLLTAAGNSVATLSMCVFFATMILLYANSAIYHGWELTTAMKKFQAKYGNIPNVSDDVRLVHHICLQGYCSGSVGRTALHADCRRSGLHRGSHILRTRQQNKVYAHRMAPLRSRRNALPLCKPLQLYSLQFIRLYRIIYANIQTNPKTRRISFLTVGFLGAFYNE